MKTLIIYNKNKYIPKFNNAVVSTFEEEFEAYKRKCKKSYWRTLECFSLEYDSCLSELKYSIWVRPGNEEVYNYIKKFYKVLEEI